MDSIFKKEKNLNRALILISILIFVLVYYFYEVHMDNISKDLFIYDNYSFYSSTDSSGDSVIKINIRNPDDFGDSFAIRTVHQEMKVYENDQLTYEYYREHPTSFGESAISKWHILPMPQDESILSITFELNSSYESISQFKNKVILGDALDIAEYASAVSAPSIAISLVVFVSGCITLLLCFAYNSKELFFKYSTIGIVQILISIWSFGEAQKFYYQLLPAPIERIFTYTALLLMSGFFFLEMSRNYTGKARRNIIFISKLSFLNVAVALILQFTSTMDLLDSIFSFFIITFIGMIYVLILKIKEYQADITGTSKIGKLGIPNIIVITTFIVYEVMTFVMGNYETSAIMLRLFFVFVSLSAFVNLVTDSFIKKGELSAAKEKLKMSQLSLISVKMQPHLVSNTLLSIQELCYRDPMEAVDAIGALAKYMRSSFNLISNKTLVPFNDELKYIHEYIAVQKICYGDEVNYVENILVSDFLVPPLTLQPLVENAVKHGIRKRASTGSIYLSTSQHNNKIIITIQDDGIGYKPETSTKDTGTDAYDSSTKSIIYRLKHLVGGTVDVSSEIDRGTQVTIAIPRNKETTQYIK